MKVGRSNEPKADNEQSVLSAATTVEIGETTVLNFAHVLGPLVVASQMVELMRRKAENLCGVAAVNEELVADLALSKRR